MQAGLGIPAVGLFCGVISTACNRATRMDSRRCLWLALIVCLGLASCAHAQDAKFWNDQARDTLQKALTREASLNRNAAKNVVMFIGDGMGIATVTAARILKGQQAGMTGEETVLAWEEFPSVGLSKTYNTNAQVADSAGTATAFFCGVKTKSGVIGVDDRATRADCSSSLNANVDSVLVDAEKAGKATGFVTTARVTHATPSSLYAHSADRNWENDGDISEEDTELGCTDIAHQLLTLGQNIKVILGGGRREFMADNIADYEYSTLNGSRKDGRNLITEWTESKDAATSRFVWNLSQFDDVDPETTEYLMGLFDRSHMKYEVDRAADVGGEPSIAEMTEKAIQILQKDEDGFFLMVEGGRIDHAHHDGAAGAALADTVAFDEAVAMAIEMTKEEETLIIVTADHSHVMAIGGYPVRGNPILGLYNYDNGLDDLPYTTLGYYNGPGAVLETASFAMNDQRRNLTSVDTENPKFLQSAIVPLASESHGGEDVAIYANGPMSHLIHGVHEQHYIAHVVRYAACLGTDTTRCKDYVVPCSSAEWIHGTAALLNTLAMTALALICVHLRF